MSFDSREFIGREWDQSIVPTLTEYVRIPNKSPAFERDWAALGHMDRAVELLAAWARKVPIPGLRVDVRRLPGRTPLLIVDIPGEFDDVVLLYGHLDKQPEFSGWLPGLGPWEPVIRDGKLYGRGGADDGYALFSSLTAISVLKQRGVHLARCVVLIEASEESGSVDLPAHLEALGDALGTPSLVVCLDAECSNYEQLWCTTSLRGLLGGTLRIRVLEEGVHSGMGSGIAPAAFRIAMQLIARLENPVTGEVLVDALHAPVPADRRTQIAGAAAVLGQAILTKMRLAGGTRPVSNDPAELLINNTWKPALAVIGADGLPAIEAAGNVMLPEVKLALSMRLPPTVDPATAASAVKQVLEADPPYGATVAFEAKQGSAGWNSPPVAPWLERAIDRASRAAFDRDAVYLGAGGTIPFMKMLGDRFPKTQFFITGLLGPQSNAHGPNEFLHIAYAKRLTECVASVIEDHARQASRG
jgi:acetylornithine deacetylase/succinyl-diaminopimelate desuccinylase-like protein